MAMIALVGGFAAPSALGAQGTLENPRTDSSYSGIGFISGWVCDANRVDIIIDEVTTVEAVYGTSRGDTVSECGDANNGFGLLINWNLLGDGTHTVRVLADGVQFSSATFTVTTILGEEFVQGAEGSFRLPGFPYPFTDVIIRWEEDLQNFVIERVEMTVVDVPVGGI
jgi:hypothetical protein